MREITFSRTTKNLIRFFCFNGIIVEILWLIRFLVQTNFTLGLSEITSIHAFFMSDLNTAVINTISLIFFIILLFLPRHFIIFAIISFLYSFKIMIIDTVAKYPIGQLLYLMGIACIVFLGLFRTHRMLKIISSFLINYIAIGHSIRFGVDVLINSIISAIGYSLVFLVTLFFAASFFRFLYTTKHARVWDLSQYPELTNRDKEWLKQILDERKYDEIAFDSGITVGTLKNRMHQIYNIVGIEDRISLMATYGGYEVKF